MTELNGWWKGAALAVLGVSALFWGGYTYHRLAVSEQGQAATGSEMRDIDRRLTTLEADKRAIRESLDEIKQTLRLLNDKFDRVPR